MNTGLYLSKEQKKSYGILLGSILVTAIIALTGVLYLAYWGRIPSTINVRAGMEQQLDFRIPVSGKIRSCEENSNREENNRRAVAVMEHSIPVDFTHSVTMKTGQVNHYRMDLKLFGVIPYKTVDIQVIPDRQLIPSGMPIGIYVKTNGVLVVGIGSFKNENGDEVSPAKYALQKGDYIMQIDGIRLENKKDFVHRVEESNGNSMIMTIRRNDELTDVIVKPEKAESGSYKIGTWIRDNAQGIGTMTYQGTDHSFGALGHGINDIDTSVLMSLEKGTLYRTDIVGITRGTSGSPGEMTGYIDYGEDNVIGEILKNTTEGIYGVYNDKLQPDVYQEPIPIGLKQELQVGPAQIICSVNGQAEYYDIEILEINMDRNNVNRGIVLQVTDEKLLALTGGIIQGMSGSPIIQNGHIVGAVTHVFVSNPSKGYGIFIEEMLSQNRPYIANK